MFIKVVSERRGQDFQEPLRCRRLRITELMNEGVVVGKQVRLCYPYPMEDVIIKLPRDGEAVYIMNNDGHTIDSVRWPPRPKKEKD